MSGPLAAPTLGALIGDLPLPRRAQHAWLRDPESGAAIDEGVALWFPAPHSVTGEDVAEL